MTSIGGQVAWSNPSDLRLKKEIQTSSFGLNFINKLRPVTYHLKTGTTDLQSGFIAQEVESAANSVGYQFSGIVKPASEKDFYSLRYSEFVVPLVKAVQEQQVIIEQQDKKIADLETRLQRLEVVVSKLK
uniref:tail fiber domain-containing protein n=1 Tax=Flavobacterium sp. Root935 TaxID=1736610 RepID=UPI003977E13C